MFDEIILGIGVLIIGVLLGYVLATRESITAVQSVENWIESTESNKWVHYEYYKDLENKYESLLKEYENYRGMIKVIQDIKGENYER